MWCSCTISIGRLLPLTWMKLSSGGLCIFVPEVRVGKVCTAPNRTTSRVLVGSRPITHNRHEKHHQWSVVAKAREDKDCEANLIKNIEA